MPIGTVTTHGNGDVKSIRLLQSTIATSAAPTTESQGLGIEPVEALFGATPLEVSLLLYSTAGSDTMTCTCRLWGMRRIGSAIMWFPIGTGTDALKGTINATVATGETGTDMIRHCEIVSLIGLAGSRIYLQVVAIGGTATAVAADIEVRRGYPV